MKVRKKEIKLIIFSVAFAISYVSSFILGIRLKEEFKNLPSKEDDFLSNY